MNWRFPSCYSSSGSCWFSCEHSSLSNLIQVSCNKFPYLFGSISSRHLRHCHHCLWSPYFVVPLPLPLHIHIHIHNPYKNHKDSLFLVFRVILCLIIHFCNPSGTIWSAIWNYKCMWHPHHARRQRITTLFVFRCRNSCPPCVLAVNWCNWKSMLHLCFWYLDHHVTGHTLQCLPKLMFCWCSVVSFYLIWSLITFEYIFYSSMIREVRWK